MESIKTNEGKSMISKVPEVTIFFWIIKVLCNTVGETASDFLNVNLGFGLTWTSIVMGRCCWLLSSLSLRRRNLSLAFIG